MLYDEEGILMMSDMAKILFLSYSLKFLTISIFFSKGTCREFKSFFMRDFDEIGC